MKVPQIEANIKSVECKKATDENGSELAKSNYFFDVDGQRVTVEVHATVTNFFLVPGSHDKLVSKSEVIQACERLIDTNCCPERSAPLVLDEYSVMPIAASLGWKDRRLT